MNPDSPITVPLFVDSRVAGSPLRLVRCSYLVVECDQPRQGWSLGVGGATLPFLMLGLLGVIVIRLESAQQIELLLEAIEKAGLDIGSGDVWLPEGVFHGGERASGEVFRALEHTFRAGLLFREGQIDAERFGAALRLMQATAEWSGEETKAYAEWSARQTSDARERYPKNRELVLPRFPRRGV